VLKELSEYCSDEKDKQHLNDITAPTDEGKVQRGYMRTYAILCYTKSMMYIVCVVIFVGVIFLWKVSQKEFMRFNFHWSSVSCNVLVLLDGTFIDNFLKYDRKIDNRKYDNKVFGNLNEKLKLY